MISDEEIVERVRALAQRGHGPRPQGMQEWQWGDPGCSAHNEGLECCVDIILCEHEYIFPYPDNPHEQCKHCGDWIYHYA